MKLHRLILAGWLVAFGPAIGAAAQDSNVIGKTIRSATLVNTKFCFNNGVCNWGGWKPAYVLAYIGEDRKAYMQDIGDYSVDVIALGVRDATGYRLDVGRDTFSTEISDDDVYMRYDYAVTGDSCRVTFTARFKDGNGRLDDVRYQRKECIVYEGDRFGLSDN